MIDFNVISGIAANDDGSRSNHVVKMGFNLDNQRPAFGRNFTSMESNWHTGGQNLLEYHYEAGTPNGQEYSRLFSSTFVRRDSMLRCENTWDFRGTSFNWYDLLGNAKMSIIGKKFQVYGSGRFTDSLYLDKILVSKTPGTGIYNFSNIASSASQKLDSVQFTTNITSPDGANDVHLTTYSTDAGGAGINLVTTSEFEASTASMYILSRPAGTTKIQAEADSIQMAGNLVFLPKTTTTAGTTGNRTINSINGNFRIAAAGTTVTITNSYVDAESNVFCVIRSNDATATIKNVVPSAGQFIVNLGAAATAEVSIGFFVVN
jgi:hypothetical protein